MNEITEILRKYKIRPNKNLGQNFLIDQFVADKIIVASGIDSNSVVLEVGSGVGSLTKELVKTAKKVIVVEIDKTMCDILKKEYGHFENLEIINADILKTEVSQIAKDEGGISVCANLPYYITTPVIMYFLEGAAGIKSLTLMMQREVADRLIALPDTKNYGAITPAVNYHADVTMVANVPPNCFIPRPAVHSAVIKFSVLDKKRVSPKDEQLMFKVIKAAFGQRRKTLQNALSNQLLPSIGMTKEQLNDCFAESGILPSVRGEVLGLSEFCKLSDSIFCKIHSDIFY